MYVHKTKWNRKKSLFSLPSVSVFFARFPSHETTFSFSARKMILDRTMEIHTVEQKEIKLMLFHYSHCYPCISYAGIYLLGIQQETGFFPYPTFQIRIHHSKPYISPVTTSVQENVQSIKISSYLPKVELKILRKRTNTVKNLKRHNIETNYLVIYSQSFDRESYPFIWLCIMLLYRLP